MIHVMRVRWDAPVWVAGVLAVALGLQLAWALAVQFGVLDPNVESDAPISAPPATPAAPLPQVAQMMEAGLFGSREAATAGDPLEEGEAHGRLGGEGAAGGREAWQRGGVSSIALGVVSHAVGASS